MSIMHEDISKPPMVVLAESLPRLHMKHPKSTVFII